MKKENSKNSYFNYFDFGFSSYTDRLLVRIREEIYHLFINTFSPGGKDRILDVGISEDNHASSNYLEKKYPYLDNIVALGIDDFRELERQFPGLTFLIGDGRHLPLRKNSFDYVYSHAVIEHVGSFQNQATFIRELVRVARNGVFITTPNRWHPFEMHTGLPLVHYLPMRIHHFLYRMSGKAMYTSEDTLHLLSHREILARLRSVAVEIPDTSFQYTFWMGFPANLVLVIKNCFKYE